MAKGTSVIVITILIKESDDRILNTAAKRVLLTPTEAELEEFRNIREAIKGVLVSSMDEGSAFLEGSGAEERINNYISNQIKEEVGKHKRRHRGVDI